MSRIFAKQCDAAKWQPSFSASHRLQCVPSVINVVCTQWQSRSNDNNVLTRDTCVCVCVCVFVFVCVVCGDQFKALH
jgi:hypothetical protein